METSGDREQESYAAIHAGHGQVHQGNLAEQLDNHYRNTGNVSAPPQTLVPGESRAIASISNGCVPLYRDADGNIVIATPSDADAAARASFLPATTSHPSRRPSVSCSTRRIRSSRNHPYTLRAASSSVSSVASASSAHSQFSQNATPDLYGQTSASTSNYPDLGILASTADNVLAADNGQARDGPVNNASLPTWDDSIYFHSRSSSISSIASDLSSSSQTSSGWSDVSNSRDISRTNFSCDPSFGHNAAFMPDQYYASLSYTSSPATQLSEYAYGQRTAQNGTTSLACLDGGITQRLTNDVVQQIQLYAQHSSPPSIFPVAYQSQTQASNTSASSTTPQYTPSPTPCPSQHIEFLSDTSMTMHATSATSLDLGIDRTLAELASNIQKSPASNNNSEKAKINFVHAWLKQSFILHPEGSLSRHALYNSYIHVCHKYNLVPVNAASYGKAVRSCWPGIKTRRLGVRGSSRYHYCGLKPVDTNIKALIDYYSSYGDDGKAVTCGLFGREASRGSSDGDDGLTEGGAFSSSSSSCSAQDDLVTHLNGLHGLGLCGSGVPPARPENGLTSIPLLPPDVFNAKVESPGTSLSQHEGSNQNRQSQEASSSDSEMQIPFADHSISDPEELPSYGPFSYRGCNNERQNMKGSSGASSLNDVIQNQTQQEQHQNTPELVFADAKTPTAFQFRQHQYQSMGDVHTTAASSESLTPNATPSGAGCTSAPRFVPQMGSHASAEKYDLSTTDISPSSTSPKVYSNQGHVQTPSKITGKSASPAFSTVRSASIPGASATLDSFAPRFKGRRVTLPDLQITIPPLRKNPLSGGGSVEKGQPDHSLPDGGGTGTKDRDDGEEEEENVLGEGKKTARRIPDPESYTSEIPTMLDLPLPSFHEIVQRFSAKLVESPNHPGSRHVSPFSGGQRDSSSSISAEPVIQARNRSIALMKDLNVHLAQEVWELYRTSHCRGLLRLVQQGKLEEFGSAFLLFWAQLDPTQQALVQHPLLSDAMYQADALLYPLLLSQLSERVLSPSALPSLFSSSFSSQQTVAAKPTPVDLLQLVHISKNLEEWAVSAFDAYSKEFADCRIELASRTAHLLGRLAGVAQLAQALSRTLSVPCAMDDLLSAWLNLDFEIIINQCALVTGCAQKTIQSYLNSFRDILHSIKAHLSATTAAPSGPHSENHFCIRPLLDYPNTALERYIITLAESSGRLSGIREDKKGWRSGDAFAAANLKLDERPFLVKWSYVSGQILRDLIISSSSAFGSFQILALFLEEYLAFKVLRNYTLRSDNVAASIQADNVNVMADAQLAMPANYINGGSSPSASNAKGLQACAPYTMQQGSRDNGVQAFLLSPAPAVRTMNGSQANPANQCDDNETAFPFAQSSASAYTTSFDSSNMSMNWSPATRHLFGELSLPSAKTTTFPDSSCTAPLNTPMQSSFRNPALPTQTAKFKVSPTMTPPSLSISGASYEEQDLATLPPPTPSAFSSFPNLKSPGLSRYFPSAGSFSSSN